MKTHVSGHPRGAKGPVHPTHAQAYWLDATHMLLVLAKEVAAAGRRFRHARHEAPEATAVDYLVLVLHRTAELTARAREEGRTLEWILPPIEEAADAVPSLRLGRRVSAVIELDAYRGGRRHG